MRQVLVVVFVFVMAAVAVSTGSPRRFGRPHVVSSATSFGRTLGYVTVNIHKEEWPAIWEPSLDYTATFTLNPEADNELLTESVTTNAGGVSRVILTCVGTFELPEPDSICHAPESPGALLPEQIKFYRRHLNVYQVLYREIARQRDEAARGLKHAQRPDVVQSGRFLYNDTALWYTETFLGEGGRGENQAFGGDGCHGGDGRTGQSDARGVPCSGRCQAALCRIGDVGRRDQALLAYSELRRP